MKTAMKNQTTFVKDLPAKEIKVTRVFNSTLENVWRSWTDRELLDQWWAPHPWKTKTKSMNFTEGGTWLYAMVGPENAIHWSRADFMKIKNLSYYIGKDCFCDEHGIMNPALPSNEWKVSFFQVDGGTRVEVDMTFTSEADFQQIIDMGFQERFASAHGNLDELLLKM